MSLAVFFHHRFSVIAFPSLHSLIFISALFEMNPMKRLLFFVSIAALSLSFAACKSASNNESANTSQPAATPAAEFTPPPGSEEISEATLRSEERRVGKECGARWAPGHGEEEGDEALHGHAERTQGRCDK